MRDAEFRAWSYDAALALTALVLVRSGGILSPKSSGYMHSAYFFPPDPCAGHSTPFAPVGLAIGSLARTDGDPSRRCGGTGCN